MFPAGFPRVLLVAAVWSALALSAVGGEKWIRLRASPVRTPDPVAARLGLQAPDPEVSGLYLVQFEAPPDLEVRDQLLLRGVELLRYVPDDAFIARLRRARLGAVRAVPQVRWVGEYRPDLRVAPQLRALVAAGEPLEVSLALAPGLLPEEQVALRRALQRVTRQSTSGFGSILQARITPAQLAILSRSSAVLWLEPAPRMKLFDEIAAKIVAGGEYETGTADDGFPDIGGGGGGDDDEEGGLASGAGARALQGNGGQGNTHQTTMQRLGYDGRGVTVAVADSGLHNGDAETMHPDLAGRVTGFFHYGSLTDASDEHSHGTHVAGIVAGNGATGETDSFNNLYGLGVAPGASIIAQRIFDGVGNYEPPPTNETLTRDAVRAGADIGSNSWGDDTQGRYDLSAAEFDALVRDADELTPGDQPYILEFSAGNSGPGTQTIGSPAVGKNVIATGAAQNDRYGYFLFEDGPEAMADFSSRGPCEDGRIKPDIVAPGTWIASLQSASASDENAWSPISANYQFQGGTSQSGPHASGAAAIFVQYWREANGGATPSPALVKGALINSATDLDGESGGTASIPNHDEGWGRITLTNLIGAVRRTQFVDQTVALTNLAVYERRVLVGDPHEPFRVTLVYTDVPALPAAVPALVNDLDLEVVGPDGTLYRGNAFDGGDSIPNAFAADTINNVEGVHLLAPALGEYVVRVRARRVVADVFRRSGVQPAQDFALVLSGNLPLPGEGVIALDREAYPAPTTATVRLIDFDLREAGSFEILVRSDTEPSGERIRLTPVGTTGVFTGAVVLAVGAVAADGALQVAHEDGVTAEYPDAAPAGLRIAEAVVDLVPPVITGVSGGTRFGRVEVTWETDEASDSRVEFGSSATLLDRVSTSRIPVESHRLALEGITPGQKVYYRVVSRDLAGNVRVVDAGGKPFEAEASAGATVLLVNQFDDLILNDYVDITGYTDALAAAGVSFEVWDVQTEGRSPGFDELKGYPVVIWRVSEFFAALGASEVKAIRDYVAGGGGFFMASMEVLSRLDESGFSSFRRNVLHVDEFDVDPGLGGIYGSDSLSLSSGVSTELDFSSYPDLFIIPQDLSDTFRVTTNAAPVLFDGATGRAVGVRYPATGSIASTGRVVFFSFPFDTIPLDGEGANGRVELLRRVLAFLAPSVIPGGAMELDREEYTLPSMMTVEVSDRDRLTDPVLTVTAKSTLEPVGESVELRATPEPGVFRGSVRLVRETAAVAVGELRARNGDLIELTYPGTGAAPALTVSAVVDIEPSLVTGVEIKPDYNDAVVTWTTSEPTDGLVKYFDVGFPSNFTVYHADFLEAHELKLVGLEPDRDYEIQIVCRDPAGNTTTDDNAGKLYRFRTLKPLTPPFVDNLETGSSYWTVGNSALDEETASLTTASAWELGRPENEIASAAHSPSSCWGTNLRGEVNDYSDTSLISPAMLLSGGNRATLRFWHNYDFVPRSEEGDIIEVGGLYVTTNNGAVWTPLTEYGEASDGWEEEEVDLTAYLGKVVRFGWAYGMFSLGAVAHPGWLLDDVSVTVTRFVPATLVISNTLDQAVVNISGPVTRVERGRSVVLTNVPAGSYTFQFGDVPFYLTPATRVETVPEGGTVAVVGAYGYPDTNGNGASDLWEQHYFGGLTTGGAASDYDGDGMSDVAEFTAGTHPTNQTSRLQILVPSLIAGGGVQVRWESVPGYGYQVEGSADALHWQALTPWIRAGSSASSAVVTSVTNGAPYLFRLGARP
ncbi:MAG: S8 family serine peptidase [Verrucomicrobiales bacterium]|nr:S8 family serine peptidase [Verrucomicrobiales bacterium]